MSATELVRLHNDFPQIRRRAVRTLQVNLGYRCNQTCFHCHVNAGPNRRENMIRETVDDLLALLRRSRIETLDLTGGAPEMNPYFREVVVAARELGIHVIDRCNLTILEEPEYAGTAEFLRDHQVEVVASLPCYSEDNVDAQRGDGVFEASIAALRRLNALGYGQPDSRLALTLVYNPLGASLPPSQDTLEAAYRRHLGEEFGIVFTCLFTIANMPINRFAKDLRKQGQLGAYMELLRDSHREANLDGVMCRDTLSVDWQGEIYDCDFNQMLHLSAAGHRRHIRDLSLDSLEGESIAVADHCFGCTAGQGSSCGGALK
ncbi:arsenosugar biosynthesis radical SAM protein ArsS [Methylonatrum kenyense]|uniref:arsenosugar biosynthesis radical SAM (seleno)protein ArsS n=1 Tax=Methylonatrum kenyense TaxID=455253 RepID=UPI00200A1155|nr:arsenosugar biosynthesis radical SAM (seleno)protein ArsS [Methylonatrum kenyense]MCK8514798.1 arsenosugar biosynthesis radical SAM protein ArsS [Methylonatrum kenyense]